MKKIVPVLIILVLLAVGGYFYMKSKRTMPVSNPVAKQDQLHQNNVFTSIQDALSRSLTLQCDYKDERGVQTTTYIKSGSVRVIMSGMADPKQPNNIIVKDKKMYMWNDTDKTGFTYTITEPSVAPGTTGTVQGQPPSTSDKQASVLATVETIQKCFVKPQMWPTLSFRSQLTLSSRI